MNQEKIKNLIELSKQDDKVAFRQLVEICQPFVFRLAFRLLCCADDAKDIVQETFIRVWIHLNKYHFRNSFSTWLYKITCNLCFDKLRSMKLSPNNATISIELSELVTPDESDIEQNIINNELIKRIITLTNELSPKQRLVFTLRDIEGLELEEVQEITGLSNAKIKSNLYLARQYVREKIKNI
jgi:RNA polymerase sigma-70 factor (ECF subfamily)